MNRMEDTFTRMFMANAWRSEESISGHGSTLRYTENLRGALPALFEEYQIRDVFDAPCGDFNWMRLVVDKTPIIYLGGDVVRPLIDNNNFRYGKNGHVRFVPFDITADRFPRSDLWVCRDCLFHFPFSDIFDALARFAESEIRYALMSTHVNDQRFANTELKNLGEFRLIDLLSEPFGFPAPLRAIEDWVVGYPPRLMCLWTRAQIAGALERRFPDRA